MGAARRLLMAGAGGSFTSPYAAKSLSATGLWSGISEPVAWHAGTKTFLCWSDDTPHGWVGTWDGTTLSQTDLGSFAPAVDGAIHVSPSLCVRASDGRILVSSVPNGTGTCRVWTSTSPSDTSAGSWANVGSSAVYTYGTFVQNSAGLYLFVKLWPGDGKGYLAYFKSTDDGATWGARTTLMAPASTTSFYWRIGTDGATRCDIFATSTDRVASPAAVYHFRFEGDALLKSDGTAVAGAWPVASNTGTLVRDATGGSARSAGWGYDGSGNPACLVLLDTGTTNTAHVAVWSGSAWVLHDPPAADQGGFVAGNHFLGGAAMDPGNPYRFWMPVKSGANFAMARFESRDSGATWSQATVNADASDNYMPYAAVSPAIGMRAVWADGAWTSDSVFSPSLHGGG